MSKVIMSVGFVLAIAAYVVGIIVIATTPDMHAVPTPNRLVAGGAAAMMGTTLALVLVFAHGSRVGDSE